MKKTILACLALAGVAPITHAIEITGSSLGVEAYQEHYSEFQTGRKIMQEKGNMASLVGSTNLKLDDENSLLLAGRYAFGKSDYTGAFQGGNYGDVQSNGQDRQAWEVQAIFKRRLAIGSLQDINIGAGLGLRHLEDSMEQAAVGGYNRKNDLSYLKFSLDKKFTLESGINVTPSIAYKHLIEGTQTSMIGDADLKHTQKKGFGFDLSVELERKIGANTFYAAPFYRYWNIEDSQTVYAIINGNLYSTVEPKNKTHEYGVAVGMKF